MNANKFAQTYLQIRLLLSRFGWITSLAWLLIFAGVAAGLWYIPYLKKQANSLTEKLQQAQIALQTIQSEAKEASIPVQEQRLKAFYELLGDSRYAEQQVKTLFAVAGKSGLTLNQAEYKSAYDKASSVHTYQVTLPVKGTYEAIRHFCEQTLLAIPFSSLDEINFKRDAINSQILEAKLRFSFYLTTPKGASSSEKVQSASANLETQS